MDLYKVLNINNKNVSQDEIEKAYKHLIRKYHPSLNPGDKLAEEKYKNIRLAFEVLSNPELRKKYDNNENLKLEIPLDEDFSTSKDDFVNISNINVSDTNESISKINNDINHYIDVDFYEAFFGTHKELQIEIPKKCLYCLNPNTNEIEIDKKDNCKICKGMGYFKSVEKIKFYIPPGVDNGYLIKICKNNENNWLCNVNIFIRFIPNEFFERKGKNIYIEIPITIIEAILGGIIDIPTPEGIYEMRIPEGTDTGSVFKIAGKGFSQLKKNTRGDLYVKVKIITPKNVDEQGKNLLLKFSQMFPYDPREKIRNISSNKVKQSSI